MVKITFVKIGNITLTTLIDIMLDERASRTDVESTVISSSTRMKPEAAERLFPLIDQVETDLMVMISPNANDKGPQLVVDKYKEKYPLIVVSDAADKEVREKWKEEGVGYIIAPFDPMIGAKRDFLDPTEMCLFNGYIITAFSTCGVFAYITDLLDSVIDQLKKGEKSSLPTRNMSSIGVVTSYPFANPYSRPKAMAALNILQDAGKLNVNGCFIEKTRERSIIKVNAAHEMVRQAAKIADEVRELEKTTDHVVRNPHGKDGEILHKKHFFDEAHKEQ
ncbi:MAG: F420-dependent methylenetetrahydromethanopterin dehydrogenase [Candidatus Heimdallarchaeota archaeon]|nr:F420-dependent methylenetetrahydromethanopterin dehydrogenase [Candidatus Heimdallarchaeota archaeon]MCK4954351.1 F420-dependent methylenetetrahydromethanopterin dehydrogenase [Candidatus Heimdallarchaeota archaeon]